MVYPDVAFKMVTDDGLSQHELSTLADLKVHHNHAKACSKLLLDGWRIDLSRECPHSIELYWVDPEGQVPEPISTSHAFILRNARRLQWSSSS